ncbi:probable glutaredoxin [Cephalotrichum gorgonifer]|uniref:Probable glutaredoxin n=1 Tax=Cephalotrichum gorgonifer TaxID=2041049 RepID=A0AAE8MVR5_9PEZI|nr:probable glutaredoxin [Cephalotrichum gorgonifer]
MSTVTEITSLADWQKHIASLPPSAVHIIYFHAPWAAPCAQMTTVIQTLATEYPVTDPPTTLWASINAEDLEDISEEYDVSVVPYIVISRGGQVLETVSGSSATKVRTAIQNHANKASAPDSAASNGAAKTEADQTAAPVDGTEEVAPQDPEKQKEELHKRLADLVKAASVMLFMKGTPSEPQCGFSRQIVGILRENSVKYGFFNILADDEVRQGLKEFADWPTYPQLWVDGELVGGLDIVKEELASNADFFKPYSVVEAAAE